MYIQLNRWFIFILALFIVPGVVYTQNPSLIQAHILILPAEFRDQHTFLSEQSFALYETLNSILEAESEYTLLSPEEFASILLDTLSPSSMNTGNQQDTMLNRLRNHPTLKLNHYDYLVSTTVIENEGTLDAEILFYNLQSERLDSDFSFSITDIPIDAIEKISQRILLQLLEYIGKNYNQTAHPDLELKLLRLQQRYTVGDTESYYEVVEEYRTLLEQYPSEPRVMAGIAKISARLGQIWRMWDNERSEWFLNVAYSYGYNALKQDPTNLDAHLALSLVFRIREIPQKMIEHLLLAEAENPDHFEVLLLAGEVYQGLYFQEGSDPERSLRYLKRALMMQPHNVAVQLAIAGTFKRLGRLDEGIRILEHLIQRHPQEAMAYNNLAGMYFARNDLCQAEQFYQKGLALDPENVFILYNAAIALGHNGKIDEALAYWKSLIDHPATTQRMLAIVRDQIEQLEATSNTFPQPLKPEQAGTQQSVNS
jgi:tetratricopeptide (TPR) repeat protein